MASNSFLSPAFCILPLQILVHSSSVNMQYLALSALLLASIAAAAPSPASSVSSAPPSTPTDPYTSSDPNLPLWNAHSDVTPEPIRGPLGATILGPQNLELELQNPDLLAPPTTDNGDMSVFLESYLQQPLIFTPLSPNIKWPFSLSHNRLATGGWARQQNGLCALLDAI